MRGEPRRAGRKPPVGLAPAARGVGRGACAVRRRRRARGPREARPDPRARDPARRGGKRPAHAQIGAPGWPGWGRGGGVSKKEPDPLAAEAMAARSPPSPPPARLSGTRSSRVGRGAAVHAVSSEASGLGGEARGAVVDRGDLSRPGGEGPGGQRGPGGSAPAKAPLLRAPPGPERLEGLSVEEVMVARMQLLEEELSSLKEELALCQVSRPPWRAGDPLPPPRAAWPRGLVPPAPPAALLPPGSLPLLDRGPGPPCTPAEQRTALGSRVWLSSPGCGLGPRSRPARASSPSRVSAEAQGAAGGRAGHALQCGAGKWNTRSSEMHRGRSLFLVFRPTPSLASPST